MELDRSCMDTEIHTLRILFRKNSTINSCFAPKYVFLYGWSLKFGKKYKDVLPEKLKRDARTNLS